MFPPLNILFEYWIEHVTSRLLCVMFRFSSWIFYRGVPCFAIDCLCCVWCRGLTTCLLHVGPLFGNQVWNYSGFVSLTQWRATVSFFLLRFTYILMPHNMMILYFRLPYFHVSNSALFLHSISVLSSYIDVDLTLSNRYLSLTLSLLWRHSERDNVSNHQRLYCLLKCLFRRRSKITSKLRVTGLCAWNSPGTGIVSNIIQMMNVKAEKV